MCIPTKEVFYLFITSEEHEKMNTKFLSYLQKMHWTTMSRFLITFIWHLRSLMRGVGQFNKQNGLERWFTIVCYNLADYKLNKFLETNKLYYKLQYWFELYRLHVYINSSNIKALFGTQKILGKEKKILRKIIFSCLVSP